MQAILNVLGNIGFNWHVAVLNFFNFLVILFILNKFFFKKIGHTMRERDEKIKKGIADADEAGQQLTQAETEKKSILHKAKTQSHEIMSTATDKAEAAARDIILKSEHEAEALRSKLKSDIADAMDKAYAEVSSQTPELVRSVIKSVMKGQMTAELNAIYVKDIIKSKL